MYFGRSVHSIWPLKLPGESVQRVKQRLNYRIIMVYDGYKDCNRNGFRGFASGSVLKKKIKKFGSG